MTNNEQTQIFQKNLLKYLHERHKTQKEVADAIGVNHQTFSTWCCGVAYPRMGKVQALADYFGINKSDLIEDKSQMPEDEKAKELFVLIENLPTQKKEHLRAYIQFLLSQP